MFDRLELYTYSILLIVFFCAMIVGTIRGVVRLNADAECKAAGWRSASVTWNLKPYCHKEINETEITVPLSDV